MSIFTGAGVALVTPFKEDLSVEQTVSLSVELQEKLLQCLMMSRSR